MKKIINNAFILSGVMIISRILEVIFYSFLYPIIGVKGGALVGYSRVISNVFLSVSTVCIALVIKKITVMYNNKGYYKTKKKMFNVTNISLLLFGLLSFILIFILAPSISYLIIGNYSGGNNREVITNVIRLMGFSILIYPLINSYRGYLEGHFLGKITNISHVIEIIIKCLTILIGSYVVVNILNKDYTYGVYISIGAYIITLFITLIYLYYQSKKNSSRIDFEIKTVHEKEISNKEIINKIITYGLPFMLIYLFISLYDLVDVLSVVKGLIVYAAYEVEDAEKVMANMLVWGNVFSVIIIGISTGIISKINPLFTNGIEKDKKKLDKNINSSINLFLFLALPVATFISVLSGPIWNLFYGNFDGEVLLSFLIMESIFISLFILIQTISALCMDTKKLSIIMGIGLIFKILLNNNMIANLNKMGMPAYYGPILASIIGYLVTIIISVIVLRKEYKIDFSKSFNSIVNIGVAALICSVALSFIKIIIPVGSPNRFISLLVIIAYLVIGSFIYISYSIISGLVDEVFDKKVLRKKLL